MLGDIEIAQSLQDDDDAGGSTKSLLDENYERLNADLDLVKPRY